MSGEARGWPAGCHLVVTRTGTLLVGEDPRVTASPAITPDGRHPLPPPLARADLDDLRALTRQPEHPSWSGRWRPLDLPRPPKRPPDPDRPLVARLPAVLAPAVDGFAVSSPDGPVRIGPDHVEVLQAFLAPARPRSDGIVDELVGAALLVDPGRVDGTFDAGARARRQSRQRQLRLRRSLPPLAEITATDDGRTPVVGLLTSLSDFPLSLGMVLAHAAAEPSLADRYRFHLAYASPAEVAAVERPCVWLFANYLWTESRNVRLAAAARRSVAPQLTVFGGPQVPGPHEVGPWLDAASADVAVHGEGELTLAELLDRLGDPTDLAAVGPVAGCTIALPDGPLTGPSRDRIADLGALPSPFLTGWFDGLGGDVFFSAVLETNRGCPYGCTFCDWGSATRSRIRSFPLDRVEAELDWVADHGFEHLLLADANFGILERDRDIAKALVRARQRTGWPHVLGTNYAKNPERHVVDIVDDLVDGGFVTIGQVALQTVDRDTLKAVNRSNIAPERYDDLLRAFDRLGLPVQTDLMMGLPGATPASFRTDLQHVVDSDVHAIVARTKVLRNSPMNEPAYRERHRIRTAGDEFIVSAASFGAADMDEMIADHSVFFAGDDLGTLRLVARFVRHRTGEEELAVLRRLAAAASAEPTRHPTTAWVLRTLARWAVEPVRWEAYLDEVRQLVVATCGLRADSALEAVLAAQAALLPAFGRTFPHTVALAHDVVAWFDDLKTVRRQGGDWSTVPDLGERGPASLTVDDPHRVCDLAMGDLALMGRTPVWDLDSPLNRPAPTGLLVTTG